MPTIGEYAREKADALLKGVCSHGAHPMWVPVTLAPECVVMTIGEALLAIARAERLASVKILQDALCPSVSHEPDECLGCNCAALLLGTAARSTPPPNEGIIV